MLRFPMISKWTCQRFEWHGGRDLLVSVLLALDCQLKWATGAGPRFDHRHGTCDAWHARHRQNSQVGPWACPPDVGRQRKPSRKPCCFWTLSTNQIRPWD